MVPIFSSSPIGHGEQRVYFVQLLVSRNFTFEIERISPPLNSLYLFNIENLVLPRMVEFSISQLKIPLCGGQSSMALPVGKGHGAWVKGMMHSGFFAVCCQLTCLVMLEYWSTGVLEEYIFQVPNRND